MLDTLDDFSDALARTGAQMIRYRAAFARRLSEAAAPIHMAFSGADEVLSVAYRTVSTVTDPTASEQAIYAEICAHQQTHKAAELASGQCLTGVHKDDLEIAINARSARAFASQGQARTAALSLKLAEREIFLEETGSIRSWLGRRAQRAGRAAPNLCPEPHRRRADAHHLLRGRRDRQQRPAAG